MSRNSLLQSTYLKIMCFLLCIPLLHIPFSNFCHSMVHIYIYILCFTDVLTPFLLLNLDLESFLFLHWVLWFCFPLVLISLLFFFLIHVVCFTFSFFDVASNVPFPSAESAEDPWEQICLFFPISSCPQPFSLWLYLVSLITAVQHPASCVLGPPSCRSGCWRKAELLYFLFKM